MPERLEETLDPGDWDAARALGRDIIDTAVARLAALRDGPVWRPMPDEARAAFRLPLPVGPTPLPAIVRDFQDTVLPHAMGNVHPRFWGWYMGAGTFTGALGDFLAAIDGSNLGGGDTAAAAVDRQVTGWLKEMMGFPEDAGATLTSGGSVANLVALTVARNAMSGVDVRKDGIANLPRPLRFYSSDQTHSCHQKALEILGHGSRSLRLIATGPDFRMSPEALAAAIEEDEAGGWKPACVIATAGTTNTGAIDDLRRIGALCRDRGLWFHVDGCIGALIRIAPDHRHLVDGIETADSLALDPHKWLHTPFEAGCAIVRDGRRHFETFTLHGDYLEVKPRGLAAGEFLADYGLELSRGFKALKIWMTLREQGIAKFGRLIDQNIAQGAWLAGRIGGEPDLELMAPVPINIVCFRYRGGEGDEGRLKALNTEIMLRLQEEGTAVPSDTTVHGRHCLRVAINNHRTRRTDLDLLVREVLRLGRDLAAS